MANTKLRNIQFYRNGQASVVTGSTVVDLKSAYKQAEQDFIGTGKYNDMLDGEILLYRFSYAGQVHTLVGVVHATVPQEGEQSTKSLEVLANYDMLGGEISAAITAALDELDGTATIASVSDGVVTLKAGIVQTNGKVSQGEGSDIVLKKVAFTGDAADVEVATGIVGLNATNVQDALAELQGDITAINSQTITAKENQAVEVTTAENGNTTIGLELAEGEKVLSQTAAGLKTTLTVDTKKYGEDAGEKAGKTYIQIKGVNGELISETDAAAFVKDGFLASVTKDEDTNELIFTWNTDAEAGEANQVTKIAIKDLCDVYTVGEGLVASGDGYTFSHQAGATGLDTTKAFGSGSATDNTITVKVPSVTVDKFGHVSALSEIEVSLEIPESVASAVQTVTGDNYVTASKNGTAVTLATKTKAVADATADADGLATAYSVKTYVNGKIEALDAEETSTDGKNVQVKVTEVDGVITAVNVTDNSINATDLTNAIAGLDAEKTSTDGTNVQVKVTEVDGVITAVNVTTDNTINATDLTNAIADLDADKSGSNANQDITVQVVEKDGKIDEVKVSDTLKSVAHTGAAADVTIEVSGNLIEATTVEGALAEIAAEIDAMDLTATDVVALNEDKTALQAGKISETDGKVAVAAAETLVEFNQAISSGNKVATMADVTAAAALAGENAIEVNPATSPATGNVVSLKINTSDKILSQNETGLLANIKLEYDSTNKLIKLLGKPTTIEGQTSPTVISTISANAFVKDGMLENAEIVSLGAGEAGEGKPAGEYIKLTFNLSESEGGNDPIYINVSDLCDVYTVDGEYLQLNASDKFKIEHKTQTNFTGTDAIKSFGGTVAEGTTADVTIEGAGQSAKFTVPSFVVDAAGHVTSAEDKVVEVKLPAAQTAADVKVTPDTELGLTSNNVQSALEELQGEINTINGVTWTDDDVVDVVKGTDGNYTISHSESGVTAGTKGDVDGTTIKVPVITVNKYGHVTALDEDSYIVKYPTVSGTEGRIKVESTTGENGVVNYAVDLAGVTVAKTSQEDDYAAAGTTEAPKNTHTRVENITVDSFGRVTGYTLTTVKEDFDAGTY